MGYRRVLVAGSCGMVSELFTNRSRGSSDGCFWVGYRVLGDRFGDWFGNSLGGIFGGVVESLNDSQRPSERPRVEASERFAEFRRAFLGVVPGAKMDRRRCAKVRVGTSFGVAFWDVIGPAGTKISEWSAAALGLLWGWCLGV